MRRLVMKMSMSLDGYVASADGTNGWIMRTGDAESRAWLEETLGEAGAHVVGRRTFELMKSHWPTSTDSLAAPMNSIPKVVFSRSAAPAADEATGPGWDEARFRGADLKADVEALKAEPGKDLLVQGGASFVRALIELGLIDRYLLVLHPIVLGSGLPLFEELDEFELALVETKRFPGGVQVLTFEPR